MIGDDWSDGKTTRTLQLFSNLDDADRTLQVHDKGYRHGEWTALDQYRFEIPRTRIITCDHLYSGRSEEPARQEVQHIFTLTGRITDENRPMTYAEFTLKWDGEPSFACSEDYRLTIDGDDSWKAAPWEEVIDQVAAWHWRAEAVDPTPPLAPRPYLPRQSGAVVGNDWEEATEDTRKLKLYGNLDDADRTLQLHDYGFREGVWTDLDQSALIITTDAHIRGACDHMFSGAESEDAAGRATYTFTLSGDITNRNEPEYYVELTLTYGGFTPRCPAGYRDLYAKEVAPWSDVMDEMKKWYWRAKAVDR